MPELAPSRRCLPWFAAALALATAHALYFGLAQPPILTDIRYFLYFALEMSRGAVPHLDFFDPKTQLASALGAVLMRTGESIGVDALSAVRAGYLALAVLFALASARIHRKLASGDPLQGFLGVTAWCAFPLLVLLPAIGNLPKLVMALSAALAVLAVRIRRWELAGLAGGLAFLDWQIGALVAGAAFVSALVHGRPRARAAGAVVLGALLPVVLTLGYHAAQGSLRPALEETLATPFLRAQEPANQEPFAERLEDMRRQLERSAPGCTPLAAAGAVGIAALVVMAVAARRKAIGAELLTLALYHSGVLAFTALDYQGRGDLFLLLTSLAFGWGFLLTQLHARLSPATARGSRRARLMDGLILLAALLIARPGPTSAAALAKRPPIPTRHVTLADQREVAAQLRELALGRRLALSDHSELLFLARLDDVLPTIYWGEAAWTHFRSGPEESSVETLGRLLRESDADLLVVSDEHAEALELARDHEVIELTSSGDRLRVRVHLRRARN